MSFLKVEDLYLYYRTRMGTLQAVDGVSFSMKKAESLALIGESGCGKTTVAQTLLHLITPDGGSVSFEGHDLGTMNSKSMRQLRQQMSIVFQNPYSSLNPKMAIYKIVGEPLQTASGMRGKALRQRVEELLREVGLGAQHMDRYPHEFSGGQRQRIGIARALALNPSFIVCDEPVSALDVSIQSQVLNILKKLQNEFNLTYLFIAHNLAVVEHISDRVAVMYLGKIVELASREELFRKPLHPYTQALISAIPIPNPHIKRKRIILAGDVPSPRNPPAGCRFHPRCPYAMDICAKKEPVFEEKKKGHWVACWLNE